ncbi:MAG: hypothetical protein HZB24_10400 [Desulfobacterales bacterium]|nr:hypothetical protein [Desulfobacterales bacterium]
MQPDTTLVRAAIERRIANASSRLAGRVTILIVAWIIVISPGMVLKNA